MKKYSLLPWIAACALSTTLCACNGFFEKDNTPTPTPLTTYNETVKPQLAWETSVNSGMGNDYLPFVPAVGDNAIYTSDRSGRIVATQKTNGGTLWSRPTDLALTAGPAVDQGFVFAGSREGILIALHAENGSPAWQVQTPSEILAPPTAAHGMVFVKTVDGQLSAYSATDGKSLWHHQQLEPQLILRGGSAPIAHEDNLLVGFANGNLVKLNQERGSELWHQAIAIPKGTFAIQRMIDIDAAPLIVGDVVYVATYQGRVAALSLHTGQVLWSHDMSTFTGLAQYGDKLFISDAAGHVYAFNRHEGSLLWQQDKLTARNVSGPAAYQDYLVVGDGEGYLHWLKQSDGQFAARQKISGGGIIAAPVIDNHMLYVLTQDGHLAAYTLG